MSLHGFGGMYHLCGTYNEHNLVSHCPHLNKWYVDGMKQSVQRRPTYALLCTLYYNYQSELHLTVEIPTQSPTTFRLDMDWYREVHRGVACKRQFAIDFRDYWGQVRILQNPAQ